MSVVTTGMKYIKCLKLRVHNNTKKIKNKPKKSLASFGGCQGPSHGGGCGGVLALLKYEIHTTKKIFKYAIQHVLTNAYSSVTTIISMVTSPLGPL